MSFRTEALALLLVGVACLAFGILVLDKPWPLALLLVGAPFGSAALVLLARSRRDK
ncbi:hypothetical protein [Actinoplanes couchii]|uniref:Uncharacterized protein n=1 Tax=Actinoplanes couchii TaxID=403638 RepID=A0ABQ3XGJ9_9ACTN|nr:hypothetical protein [Actinoplanes couchii]MDR6321090.1 hypothetical protein [Actinoplanes couchii]GID57602.1 hypothetical protein Aco03nite_060060 [Actinoplanes couchii]